MLSRLCLSLENETDKRITWNMSSVFHGVLMEILGGETASWMHEGQINPYTQYIQYDGKSVQWILSTMTAEAHQRILMPLMNASASHIYLSYHDISLKVIAKKLILLEKNEFLQSQYFRDYERYFTIQFITPVSFKSKGRYMNYPSIRWIFQSLMNKHDFVDGENQLYDEEVLETLEQKCYISQYRLRSTFFSIEGVRIPSFLGSITICVKGNQSIVNLVNYLLMFGEYSGVGIKASMGMGAIQIEHKERK